MYRKSLAVFLAVSALSGGLAKAGPFETALSVSGNEIAARAVALPVPQEVPAPAARVSELYCGGGRLQVQAKDAGRFTAVVNDAAVTAALKAAAARFYEGEQRLLNVRFTGASSFMVSDLRKAPDGYDGGQFAPKLRLLGGGRALLVLTYFRMNNSYAYDYSEVASFEFGGCVR